MQAIRELYKFGRGPSSSHTLAPERACQLFLKENGSFPSYKVELFGSLSLTGKGHATDAVIRETLGGNCDVLFSLDWDEEFPNGFYLRAYDENHVEQAKWTVFSLGGGSIQIKEYPVDYNEEVYSERTLEEVKKYIDQENMTLLEYVDQHEPDLKGYLETILDGMLDSVHRGITTSGVLPGPLQLRRGAKNLFEQTSREYQPSDEKTRLMAYAYGASEENAAGHACVTAPTLGACGVMAAMCYHAIHDLKYARSEVIDALEIGGLFGNLIKQNASISGAVAGCQAEVGAAVSMTSAAIAYLMGLHFDQVEYAAEIGMEHHLGLTCDPVMGYVMIPCIERNAMGVLRSYDAAVLARHMSSIREHLISFDMIVKTMNETGKQIPLELKETSTGGLAKEFGCHD